MTTSVTVRNVPEDVRNALASRAARRGQSLQGYLLATLTELSNRPDKDELLERITRDRELFGSSVSDAEILDALVVDRK